jgi:3-oxoacyl-[acyl-carrier protein] reductase
VNILVSGCKGGIGKALYDHYAKEGECITGISRNDVDITDWEGMSSFFSEKITDNFDLVLHCAAKNLVMRFDKTSHSAFKEIIDCNTIGTFNLLKCVIPHVVTGGSIVLFSSLSAFSPRIGQSAYATSKAALSGLVKVLAQELLASEKYIFLIAPGLVETGMPQKMMSSPVLSTAIDRIPMRRTCTITEIINTINYVKRTPYFSGQTVHLNGVYDLI